MTKIFCDIGIADVYPVGFIADLLKDWRMVTRFGMRPVYLRRGLRYLAGRLLERNWRAAKNYFNGYLAEPTDFLAWLQRCGSGWTRNRALRSLNKMIATCRPGTALESEPTMKDDTDG